MTRLIILGAGTAGTMLANTLRDALDAQWSITVVDRDNEHHYQPGYLFVPFGRMAPERVTKPRDRFLPLRNLRPPWRFLRGLRRGEAG